MFYFILGFISIFIFTYLFATPWLLDTSGAQPQVRSHRLRGGGEGASLRRAGGHARQGRGSSRRGTRRRRTSSWSRNGSYQARYGSVRGDVESIGVDSGRQIHCRDAHGPDCEAIVCIVNYNCHRALHHPEGGGVSKRSLICGTKPRQSRDAGVYVSSSEKDTSVYISGSPEYGLQKPSQNASGSGSLITSTPLKPRSFKFFERKLRCLPEVQEHELSTSTTD